MVSIAPLTSLDQPADNGNFNVSLSSTTTFVVLGGGGLRFMGMWDGTQYAEINSSLTGVNHGDWTEDETYFVCAGSDANLRLRNFIPATGASPSQRHSLALASAPYVIRRLVDDIFVVFSSSATGTVSFVKINRALEQLELIGTMTFSSVRAWDSSATGDLFVLRGGASSQFLDRVSVSSGSPVIAETLAVPRPNGASLAVSRDGTKFVIGAKTAADAVIGRANPFAVVPYTFTIAPYQALFLFNDEYIQLFPSTSPGQQYLKIAPDLSNIEVTSDIAPITFTGTVPPSASTDTVRRQSATAVGPTRTVHAWKFIATTAQPASLNVFVESAPPRTVSFNALAPMPEAFVDLEIPERLRLFAEAPMPTAMVDFLGHETSVFEAVAPMPDAFIRTLEAQSVAFEALAPMPYAFITSPTAAAYFIAELPRPKAHFQAGPPIPAHFVAVHPKPTAFFDPAAVVAPEFVAVMPRPVAVFQQRSRRRVVFFAVNED